MNLDGTSRQYRVLSVNGNVCKVMGMFDDLTSVYNSTRTTTNFNGTTAQKYESSTLDTYLNTTWYNTLSDIVKTAIIPENVIQYCYKYYNLPNTPNTPTYQYQNNWSDSDYNNVDNVGNVTVGKRNIFALDLKDIFDYIGKVCITSDELMTMFWNSTTKVSKYPWLRSSHANDSGQAWFVYGDNGSLDYSYADNSLIVRPALNLDLSKIEWSITEPVVDTTETWVINETPGSDELDNYNLPKEIFDKKFTVEFISNEKTFNNFRNETHRTGNKFGAWTIFYDDTQVYSIGDTWQVWSSNDAYRTITLSAPAAGDFLIWLQKYAVKQ